MQVKINHTIHPDAMDRHLSQEERNIKAEILRHQAPEVREVLATRAQAVLEAMIGPAPEMPDADDISRARGELRAAQAQLDEAQKRAEGKSARSAAAILAPYNKAHKEALDRTNRLSKTIQEHLIRSRVEGVWMRFLGLLRAAGGVWEARRKLLVGIVETDAGEGAKAAWVVEVHLDDIGAPDKIYIGPHKGAGRDAEALRHVSDAGEWVATYRVTNWFGDQTNEWSMDLHAYNIVASGALAFAGLARLLGMWLHGLDVLDMESSSYIWRSCHTEASTHFGLSAVWQERARTRAERIAAQQAEAEARAAKDAEVQHQRAEYVTKKGHIAAECPAHPALPPARAFTFDDGE
jgi:hypothetical protein